MGCQRERDTIERDRHAVVGDRLAFDECHEIESSGMFKTRKIAITPTGSVAETIVPNMNAATTGSCAVIESPKAMTPVVSTTPGTASTAIDHVMRRNAPASRFYAASEMSGGKKMKSSSGPKANGKSIGVVLEMIAPKPTSATAAGNRIRSATIATIAAAPSNSMNARP